MENQLGTKTTEPATMVDSFITFERTDFEASAEVLAYEAADLCGLAREYFDSGVSVKLCEARFSGNAVIVPVSGHFTLSTIQHYFRQPIRQA